MIESLARKAMVQLPESPNSCPRSFDYFPEGGIRSFYCHISHIVSYEEARMALPVGIFRSGPHTDTLDLNNAKDFGRYNPQFVDLLVEHGIPGAEDDGFRRLTQNTYDEYVSPLARIMYVTYEKLRDNPDLYRSEQRKFLQLLESPDGVPPYYYEKYFYFMNPDFAQNPEGGFEAFADNGFDGGYSGNVVKTAVYFWIRRSVDGTDQLFFRGLQKLMNAYDSAYMESH